MTWREKHFISPRQFTIHPVRRISATAIAPWLSLIHISNAIAAIDQPVTALYEPDGLNYTLYNAWKANPNVTLLAGEEPVQQLKGVKNRCV